MVGFPDSHAQGYYRVLRVHVTSSPLFSTSSWGKPHNISYTLSKQSPATELAPVPVFLIVFFLFAQGYCLVLFFLSGAVTQPTLWVPAWLSSGTRWKLALFSCYRFSKLWSWRHFCKDWGRAGDHDNRLNLRLFIYRISSLYLNVLKTFRNEHFSRRCVDMKQFIPPVMS